MREIETKEELDLISAGTFATGACTAEFGEMGGTVGKAIGKAVGPTVGGVIGAAAGTIAEPGGGTATGAIIGAAIGKKYGGSVGATVGAVIGGGLGDAICNDNSSSRESGSSSSSTVIDFACVHIDSFLQSGERAADVKEGDVLQLADEKTLESSEGVVTYSQRKLVEGFRIVTESGVSLICSDSAQIPTTRGLVLAPNLLETSVAVLQLFGSALEKKWEKVVRLESVGEIAVQHISVGNKCFWAGEKANSFILHHNLKQQTNRNNSCMADDDNWMN